MQCKCGGKMKERQKDNKPYQECVGCGRVYAPHHPGMPGYKGMQRK